MRSHQTPGIRSLDSCCEMTVAVGNGVKISLDVRCHINKNNNGGREFITLSGEKFITGAIKHLHNRLREVRVT
jgi:hypothetical protein